MLLDRVKERTGSDLSDAELQAMIDAITAELDARLGPAGPIKEVLGDPNDPRSRRLSTLRLARPIDEAQPVSVEEFDPGNAQADETLVLAADDYSIIHGGRTLVRLPGGTNGRSFWAPLVHVSYTPLGAAAQREEATIKLMMLDLTYKGAIKSERAGDYQVSLSGDPAADREAIIAPLEQRAGGMVMA